MAKKPESEHEQSDQKTSEQPSEQRQPSSAATGSAPASVNSRDIAKRPNDGLAPMPERDVFEDYATTHSSRNIVGTLLKFSKGDYLAGQANEDIPVGTKMIVNMDELLLGYIRWEDNMPADQRMGRLVDGFVEPNRDTLGYGYEPGTEEPDTSEWEINDRGQPRDPWIFTYYLVMKDPEITDEGEGVYTFTTSSEGGKNAVIDLCKLYGRKRREGYKDFYPVVALKVGSYNHKNKEFGRIKTPILSVVGWVNKSVFGVMPEPVDATEQLAQAAKGEEIPF